MFPAIQTHDFSFFNIHDKPDGALLHFITSVIGEKSISRVDYYDEHIEWKAHFNSYLFALPCEFRSVFLEYIQDAKVMMPWRCPYERSVSAFFHWSQVGQLCNALYIKDSVMDTLLDYDENIIEFDVMRKMLFCMKEKKGKLSVDTLEALFVEYFDGKLCDEYKRVDEVYRTELTSMNTLRFDLKCLPIEDIKLFLGLDEIEIPRERDKTAIRDYVFEGDVKDVFARLLERARRIDVSEEDAKYFKSSNEI